MNEYKKFAYYYDEVMSGLNYELWVDFITPYIKKTDKILDLACGSGTLCILLKLLGYDVSGLDLSFDIIDIAKEKAKINHLNIPFFVNDMTKFNLNEKYNTITCFFDSINFLKDKNQISMLFDSVYEHLEVGGYFIFDMASNIMLLEYDNHNFENDYGNFQIKWTSSVKNKTINHSIKIKTPYEEFNEKYIEYFYETKDVLDKRFKLLKLVGDFNDDFEADDERILIVMQKL